MVRSVMAMYTTVSGKKGEHIDWKHTVVGCVDKDTQLRLDYVV